MNFRSIALFSFFTITSHFVMLAQNVSCANFAFVSSQRDSLNANTYWYNIKSTAGSNVMANYPYVLAVLDCNGDTVAKGNLYYFGQFGQTTQAYPVSLTSKGNFNCYPQTILFVFNYNDGRKDTCKMTFNASSTNAFDVNQKGICLSNNPTQGSVNILAHPDLIGEAYTVFNALGQLIAKGILTAEISKLDMTSLSSGLYFLSLNKSPNHALKLIKE